MQGSCLQIGDVWHCKADPCAAHGPAPTRDWADHNHNPVIPATELGWNRLNGLIRAENALGLLCKDTDLGVGSTTLWKEAYERLEGLVYCLSRDVSFEVLLAAPLHEGEPVLGRWLRYVKAHGDRAVVETAVRKLIPGFEQSELRAWLLREGA